MRELAVTAKVAIRGLEALFDEWVTEREQHPGQAVLAKLTGVTPEMSGGGKQRSVNYRPNFAIPRWVKIPAEFESPPDKPEQYAPTPNGAGITDAYRAAKEGNAAPIAPKPQLPAAAVDEWG